MIEALLQEESARALAQLRRMAGTSGRLRTATAIPKLCTALDLPRVSVNEALRELYRAGLVAYQPDAQQLPAPGHLTVKAAAVVLAPHDVAWQHALGVARLEEGDAALFGQLSPAVADLDAQDMLVLAHALKGMQGRPSEAIDDTGFNVSARHLMGSSKVLSRLSRQMLGALGLPLRLHTPSPRYILCAGPAQPVATLLIENPRAFENAIRSGLVDEVALVCTFGFGLSYLECELWSGDQASQHDQLIPIVRDGTPPPLAQLLTAENVFLWADLDLAALSIFRSLKGSIPQLRLSAIYEVMLPMLSDPARSHPYAELFDKSGQLGRSQNDRATSSSEEGEAHAMLQSACSARAVDQESVEEGAIRRLGAFPLDMMRRRMSY